MSAFRIGLLRCPDVRINKANLPKHCKFSDFCNSGSDKQDTYGSEQDHSSSTTIGEEPSPALDNPSAPAMYECRKYGHNLPMDSVMPLFETLPCIPTGIFRCTAGEVLGPGAKKCSPYQNPEYFSFHHMTFYDMHLILRCYRTESPDTERKK